MGLGVTGRRNGISLQVFNFTLILLGDVEIRTDFILVIVQSVHFFPKVSQGRAGPDKSSNIILNIQLKVSLPFNQRAKLPLQHFNAVFNGFLSRQIKIQRLLLKADAILSDGYLLFQRILQFSIALKNSVSGFDESCILLQPRGQFQSQFQEDFLLVRQAPFVVIEFVDISLELLHVIQDIFNVFLNSVPHPPNCRHSRRLQHRNIVIHTLKISKDTKLRESRKYERY
ncbi:hypothetical protein QL285_003539 [Trifolium repens]|nr:hypothetical protein QL285_003539 [Trifolium repens]